MITGVPLAALPDEEDFADEAAVVLDDDALDDDPQAAKAVAATTPAETKSELFLKRPMILGREDVANPVTVLFQLIIRYGIP